MCQATQQSRPGLDCSTLSNMPNLLSSLSAQNPTLRAQNALFPNGTIFPRSEYFKTEKFYRAAFTPSEFNGWCVDFPGEFVAWSKWCGFWVWKSTASQSDTIPTRIIILYVWIQVYYFLNRKISHSAYNIYFFILEDTLNPLHPQPICWLREGKVGTVKLPIFGNFYFDCCKTKSIALSSSSGLINRKFAILTFKSKIILTSGHF